MSEKWIELSRKWTEISRKWTETSGKWTKTSGKWNKTSEKWTHSLDPLRIRQIIVTEHKTGKRTRTFILLSTFGSLMTG